MFIDQNILSANKVAARQAQADAIARYVAAGGVIEVLKGRKNPKAKTANGKTKGGKVFSDPTARFPRNA